MVDARARLESRILYVVVLIAFVIGFARVSQNAATASSVREGARQDVFDACVRGNKTRVELQADPKYRVARMRRAPTYNCSAILRGGDPVPLEIGTQREVLTYWLKNEKLPPLPGIGK